MKKLKQMYRCMDDRKYGNRKTTGCPTKTLGHDRRCGFTLVELVIVIAIVIILSVISVPIYRGYVEKSKISEVYALFGTILSAQKAYYSQYGNFLNNAHSSYGGGFTNHETVLGIDGRGNKYFRSFQAAASNTARPDIYFASQVRKPAELKVDPTRDEQFVLQYNITLGARILDSNEMNSTKENEWHP